MFRVWNFEAARRAGCSQFVPRFQSMFPRLERVEALAVVQVVAVYIAVSRLRTACRDHLRSLAVHLAVGSSGIR